LSRKIIQSLTESTTENAKKSIQNQFNLLADGNDVKLSIRENYFTISRLTYKKTLYYILTKVI